MSKKLLLCFVAGLLIGLAIVFPRWYPGSSRDSINSVTLYSLDGTGLQKYQPDQIKEQFHGFPVLGKIELTGNQPRRVSVRFAVPEFDNTAHIG